MLNKNLIVNPTQPNQLVKAYEVNTLQYWLLYTAVNALQYDIDNNPQILTNLSKELGLPEDTISEVLEDLYTLNQDPDVPEE